VYHWPSATDTTLCITSKSYRPACYELPESMGVLLREYCKDKGLRESDMFLIIKKAGIKYCFQGCRKVYDEDKLDQALDLYGPPLDCVDKNKAMKMIQSRDALSLAVENGIIHYVIWEGSEWVREEDVYRVIDWWVRRIYKKREEQMKQRAKKSKKTQQKFQPKKQ